MEKKPRPRPEKSGSFIIREEKRQPEPTRNLSMGAIKALFEVTEERETQELEKPKEPNFSLISGEINKFLTAAGTTPPPEIPHQAFTQLLEILEREITEDHVGISQNGESLALESIDQVSKLASVLATYPEEQAYSQASNLAGAALQRAMAFLEDEFRLHLEETAAAPPPPSPHAAAYDLERSPRTPLQELSPPAAGDSPPYSPETVEILRRIAAAMISAGYEAECCQVFALVRRNIFNSTISKLGFDKISIEEVQRMPWETLEGEISSFIKAFRYVSSISFSRERDLCSSVFSGSPHIAASLFRNLFRGVVIQLLNFSEAVAITKRSAEKLFKLLDMYEALRDLSEEMEEEDEQELRQEINAARSRLGEAAVGIFSDLENSIKSDAGRTPVPGGAVHPLTRYVMNYLKYACEYKKTLEEVFMECRRPETPSSPRDDQDRNPNPNPSHQHSPFAAQLLTVMGLLDSNLETKSRLYKDPSLSHIFLMNNGRYILQKIKGAAEIHSLVGDNWCRKRSSELRQYHKNYQRETWGKVLGCFRDEGLQVKGTVSKPVLKERFRSFNAMFEEIHKTQSCWVVSDEQLQSELRVSVCSVVVPAYRSFLGRFQQYLDSGRQSEKYIKFGPEDLETFIDDLFDGTPASTVKRRS